MQASVHVSCGLHDACGLHCSTKKRRHALYCTLTEQDLQSIMHTVLSATLTHRRARAQRCVCSDALLLPSIKQTAVLTCLGCRVGEPGTARSAARGSRREAITAECAAGVCCAWTITVHGLTIAWGTPTTKPSCSSCCVRAHIPPLHSTSCLMCNTACSACNSWSLIPGHILCRWHGHVR